MPPKHTKRKANPQDEERNVKQKPSTDGTKTCAEDALLLVASFLRDGDTMRFGRTSKANKQAMNKYPIRKTFELTQGVLLTRLPDWSEWMIGRYSCISLRLYFAGVSDTTLFELCRRFVVSNCHSRLTLTDANFDRVRMLSQISPIYAIDVGWFAKCVELPSSLKVLRLSRSDQLPSDPLPSGLTSLTISKVWDFKISLPPLLEVLELGNTDSRARIDELKLPPSLTTLKFGSEFNRPVNQLTLSPSLTRLEFGSEFNQPVSELKLPQSLRSLIIRHRLEDRWFDANQSFQQPIDKLVMPSSLTELVLDTAFNQSINNVKWPESLTSLRLGFDFNHPIHTPYLPRSLRHLKLGQNFSRAIYWDGLPPLHTLTVGCWFSHDIPRLAAIEIVRKPWRPI